MKKEIEINSIEKTIAEHLIKTISLESSNFWEIVYTLGGETNLDFFNEIDQSIIKSLIGTEASALDIDYEKVGKSIEGWCRFSVYDSVISSEYKVAHELAHTSYGAPSGVTIIDECYWGIYMESLDHLNFTEIAKYSIELMLKSHNNK